MASAQQHQVHSYAAHPPPSNHYDVRLPPIRELGVVYRDEHGPSAPPSQPEYAPVQSHPSRHDPQPWSRSSSGPGPAPSQHGAMLPPSDAPKSQYSNKPDGHGQYPPPGVPLSAQGSVGNVNSSGGRPSSGRGEPPSQPALKRARSNSSRCFRLRTLPTRHTQTILPVLANFIKATNLTKVTRRTNLLINHTNLLINHTNLLIKPTNHTSLLTRLTSRNKARPLLRRPASAYPPYVPPQHLAQRQYHTQPPPPQHPQHSQPSPNPSYPPPSPVEQWQQQPQQQQAPPPHYQSPVAQGPYNNFPRTTALVPESVDSRNGATPQDAKGASGRRDTIAQIVEHCNILYAFANRCASSPHVQPTPEELKDMSRRADLVVRLMDELRRLSLPDDQLPRDLPVPNGVEEHRPPKRPWEDTVDENENGPNAARLEQYSDDKGQSTAEIDMEIIRSKRATSAGGATPGQPKSKYRKRSRATPPGKCHSCNIRETPEWRRGPDGARTLCNACGLHYAKLMRKRDKNGIGPEGKPAITIESLRASTAPGPSPPHMGSQYPSPHLPTKAGPPPPHMQHSAHPSAHPQHPGSYPIMSAQQQSGHHPMMPPPQAHGEPAGVNVPAPPWMSSSASSSGGGRPPAYGEHQAYMRTSHPPSHARASPQ
ncbi:hypothetical protein EIP91_009869 [Steccherinum ochraceum]|uniref:GATA-type domain-containing protein n=1 Tax=Steccherinum ochraceum TaxID=92696 RepID=A0A4R0R3S4_9APHY|nr:hypothetical protein EIP91_009869 [Steccherinum ochraceum]